MKKWTKNNPEKLKAQRYRYKQKQKTKVTNINTFPAHSKHHYKKQLSIWSSIVRRSTNNKCVVCGETSKDAHHIIPKINYPFLSLLVNNGVGLCLNHHYEAHGRFALMTG